MLYELRWKLWKIVLLLLKKNFNSQSNFVLKWITSTLISIKVQKVWCGRNSSCCNTLQKLGMCLCLMKYSIVLMKFGFSVKSILRKISWNQFHGKTDISPSINLLYWRRVFQRRLGILKKAVVVFFLLPYNKDEKWNMKFWTMRNYIWSCISIHISFFKGIIFFI